MSDDLRKLQEAMRDVHGHIQDLQSGQKATTHELKEFIQATGEKFTAIDDRFRTVDETIQSLRQDVQLLRQDMQSLAGTMSSGLQLMLARHVGMEATVTALGGTFAGIEQILRRLLSHQTDLQAKCDSLESRHADVLRRLEALEKRAS